jgi:hypothetical protein
MVVVGEASCLCTYRDQSRDASTSLTFSVMVGSFRDNILTQIMSSYLYYRVLHFCIPMTAQKVRFFFAIPNISHFLSRSTPRCHLGRSLDAIRHSSIHISRWRYKTMDMLLWPATPDNTIRRTSFQNPYAAHTGTRLPFRICRRTICSIQQPRRSHQSMGSK